MCITVHTQVMDSADVCRLSRLTKQDKYISTAKFGFWGSGSENGAVFTGEHEPHGTGILRVGQHPNTHRQPHAVATTTHDFLTDRIPEQEDREDDGRF